MLRKIFKIILGVAAGTALAHYFTSHRGRTLVDRAGTKDAIEAKIEETRQRLREQLEEIAQRPTEETDLPR